jgi:FkbM family methyltransferase
MLAARLFRFLTLFSVATRNLGFAAAFTALVVGKFTHRLLTVRMRFCGRTFSFRGRDDRGVITHFMIDNYRIVDRPDRPVQYIIDAGANIGDETLRFRHFHPTATIVAVEPAADNYAVLVRNFRDDPQVKTVCRGLWPTPAKLAVERGATHEGYRVREVDGGDFDIEAVTIEQLMSDHGLPRIDILKLDIEGAEYHLFSRNTASWVPKVGVLIFECNDTDVRGAAQSVFGATLGEPFDCFISGESLVMIRRESGWSLRTSPWY